MTGKDLPVRMVTQVASAAPPSFGGDDTLYAYNLFVMTAMFFVAVMLAGRQAGRIWSQRRYDHLLHPVSLYRLIVLFASIAATLRCGAEALLLWGWNPDEADLTARVLMAKRWLDPVSVSFGFLWMAVSILGEPGMEYQLRKSPLPVDMWSRWPMLVRALGVVVLSLVMAVAAVILR